MKYLIIILFSIICIEQSQAQGPPITGDKAIMLGEQTLIVKTLTEFLSTDKGTYTYAPLMLHYLPSSNSLIAVHIPFVSAPTADLLEGNEKSGLGDIVFRGKYQIYRNDGKAKTHRIALKSVHWFPTGFNTGLADYGVDEYQTSFTIISGYETLKHGIGAEFGYKYVGGEYRDFWIAEVGFGLPLLKPTYPVNQLNLYFEYRSEWFIDGTENIFFSQGFQYAKKQLTLDFGVQIPLLESANNFVDRHYKILAGLRYVW